MLCTGPGTRLPSNQRLLLLFAYLILVSLLNQAFYLQHIYRNIRQRILYFNPPIWVIIEQQNTKTGSETKLETLNEQHNQSIMRNCSSKDWVAYETNSCLWKWFLPTNIINLVLNNVTHIIGQRQVLLCVNFLSTKDFHQFSHRSMTPPRLRTTDLDRCSHETYFVLLISRFKNKLYRSGPLEKAWIVLVLADVFWVHSEFFSSSFWVYFFVPASRDRAQLVTLRIDLSFPTLLFMH